MYDKILLHCFETLKCNKNFIEPNYIPKNCDEREKILIFNTHYKNIINNESCLLFIENSFNIIKNENIRLKDEELLTIVILILKAFINKLSLYKIKENFTNLDDILNYVSDHYDYYLILNKKYSNKKDINTLIMHILNILVDGSIIIQKKKMIKDKMFVKTVKFLKIEIIYNKEIDEYFLFSYTNFRLIEINDEYYVTTGHFLKTYVLFKKNFSSDKKFKLKNINYIIKKINVELYVDKDYQLLLKKEMKIDFSDKIENIEKYVLEINMLYDNDNWTYETKKKISELQAKISLNIDDLVYSYFANYDFSDHPIFFPIFLDFRGRKYYYSKIGPTSSKMLRPSYYYGWYNDIEFKDVEMKYSKDYINDIYNFCELYGITNKMEYYETYFWILISIGKFFINKNKYPIFTKEFIEKGINNYENNNTLELSDYLEIEHYKNIIKDMNNRKIKKRIIIKDATASINQILMKTLGPLDKYSMDYVNLGDKNSWYDTYSVCKDLFYEYIKEDKNLVTYKNKELYDKIMDRGLIKNCVMIIPYAAGDKLCWSNYVDIINNKNKKIEINKDLKKLFKEFYKFIRKDIQELYLYNKSSTAIINKMSEEFENLRKYILESDTGEADISYYKMKKSSIDKKYKSNGVNKRITKLILTPSNALDKKAFEIAAGANTVHFLDGDEIRIIEGILGYSVITIHDSYLIDFKNCGKLIEAKTEHYQKQINKLTTGYKINNIFILL